MIQLIVFGAIALVCFSAGGFIWANQATHLLQNFSPESVKNKKGLAGWSGKFLILLGCLWPIIGFFCWKYDGTPYEILPVLLAIPVTYLLLVGFLAGSQRYLKN
jgi:hypothetical protein